MKKLNQVRFSLRQGLIDSQDTSTFQGQPVPKWLQQPAVYEKSTKDDQNEIPAWVLKPVNFD